MTEDNELRGVYAGLPTPWKTDGHADLESVVENVRRCAEAGAHGVYMLSPSGEFWSAEFEEFKEIVSVFAEAVRKHDVPAQVFCGWHNVPGVIDRKRFAHSQGFSTVQVGLASWYGLSKEEAYGFFRDVSRACPDLRMVHYNTSKQGWYLDADDYLRIRENSPNLIATKSIDWDFVKITDLVRRTPEMTHFYPESVLLPAMIAGAKGCYSSAIYFHPETTLRLYNSIVCRRYSEAMDLTSRFAEFLRRTQMVFERYRSNDSVYDTLVAHLTGFLQINPVVRPPHRMLPMEGIEELSQVIDEFPEWNWSASNGP